MTREKFVELQKVDEKIKELEKQPDAFKKYAHVLEMRPVKECEYGDRNLDVLMSYSDFAHGSPKKGDMIAREPKNRKKLWLIREKEFKDNYKRI